MEDETKYETVMICEPTLDGIMSLNLFQSEALKTAHEGFDIKYMALGLAGEAGEVADKVKKVIRDNGGVFDEPHRRGIAMELGDVLWYVAVAAERIGYRLSQIAEMNNEKLRSRHERGVIGGSGDER